VAANGRIPAAFSAAFEGRSRHARAAGDCIAFAVRLDFAGRKLSRAQVTPEEPFSIRPFDGQLDEVRALFREYEAFLGIDLCFQNFEAELAELPGRYAPPDGALFLAWVGDRIEGCVALRDLGDGVCEMKRLYVRPACRGLGLGRQLAERLVEEASAIGYTKMKLDTFEFLDGAVQIYQEMGFRRTGSYYENPHQRVQYWELALSRPAGSE